jgi:hypothetical protein
VTDSPNIAILRRCTSEQRIRGRVSCTLSGSVLNSYVWSKHFLLQLPSGNAFGVYSSFKGSDEGSRQGPYPAVGVVVTPRLTGHGGSFADIDSHAQGLRHSHVWCWSLHLTRGGVHDKVERRLIEKRKDQDCEGAREAPSRGLCCDKQRIDDECRRS